MPKILLGKTQAWLHYKKMFLAVKVQQGTQERLNTAVVQRLDILQESCHQILQFLENYNHFPSAKEEKQKLGL